MHEHPPGASAAPLPVLIVETREDLLGGVIAAALAEELDMKLLGPEPASRLAAALAASERPRVVLLLCDEKADEPDAALLARHSDIAFLQVRIRDGDVLVRLRRPGLSELIRLIRLLGAPAANGTDGVVAAREGKTVAATRKGRRSRAPRAAPGPFAIRYLAGPAIHAGSYRSPRLPRP